MMAVVANPLPLMRARDADGLARVRGSLLSMAEHASALAAEALPALRAEHRRNVEVNADGVVIGVKDADLALRMAEVGASITAKVATLGLLAQEVANREDERGGLLEVVMSRRARQTIDVDVDDGDDSDSDPGPGSGG